MQRDMHSGMRRDMHSGMRRGVHRACTWQQPAVYLQCTRAAAGRHAADAWQSRAAPCVPLAAASLAVGICLPCQGFDAGGLEQGSPLVQPFLLHQRPSE
eukprot:350593-Chlamydomonas_euryale.AAC.2